MSRNSLLSRRLLSRRTLHRRPLRPLVEALERRDLLASFTTLEDTALVISDPGLANAIIVAKPARGTVVPTDAGGFVYTPAENYNGPDAFVYGFTNTANGATVGATETAAITVKSVNDAPAGADKVVQMLAGSSYAIQPSDFGFTDPKDHPSNGLKAVTIVTLPTFGKLMNGDVAITAGQTIPISDFFTISSTNNPAPTNRIRYIPDATTTTTSVSFTFAVQDDGGTENGGADTDQSPNKFTIYVSPAPKVEARNDFYSVIQNGSITIAAPGVLGNDSGINGRSLSASLEPEKGPQHGKLELQSDGSFIYKPETGYVGTDTFTYRATDNSPVVNPLPPSSATAVVTITVRSNSPYIYANNDQFSGIQNTPLTVFAPGVLANDVGYPPDATNSNPGTVPVQKIPLNAKLVTDVSHGTLQLAADGSFQYVPAKNFYGVDAFSYRAVPAPTASGETLVAGPNSHDIATVMIFVAAPFANNDFYSTQQDAALTIDPAGVLTNDKPAEGHKISALLVSRTAYGEVTLNADGGFTYKPASGYVGADTFTYRAIDTTTVPLGDASGDPNAAGATATGTDPQNTNAGGLATVTISVKPLPPAVVAKNDVFEAKVNTALEVVAPGVLKNDYVILGDPTTNTGTTIASPNYPLNASVVTGPTNGTLTLKGDGSFRYVPKDNFTGTDTFTYQATLVTSATADPNTAPRAQATVTITVKPASTMTVIAGNDFYAAAINGELNVGYDRTVLANDYVTVPNAPTINGQWPVNNAPMTAVLADKPINGTVELHEDGTFHYVPKPDFAGTDKFTYYAVLKGPGFDPSTAPRGLGTVTITVMQPVGRPQAFDDFYSTNQGQLLKVTPPGVLANDIKPVTWSSLSFLIIDKPAHGRVFDISGNGGFSYLPDSDFVGADTFTYQAFTSLDHPAPPSGDPNQYVSDLATVTINVKPINATPGVVAVPDSFDALAGEPLDVALPGVLKNDYVIYVDPVTGTATSTSGTNILPPNYPLSAIVIDKPANGTVELSRDGSFHYVPKDGFTGTDTFSYRALLTTTTNPPPVGVDSPVAPRDVAKVTINVKPVVLPPTVVAGNDIYNLVINKVLEVDSSDGVLRNDFVKLSNSPNNIIQSGSPLIAVLGDKPANGTLELHEDGSFRYVPTADFAGMDKFTYYAVLKSTTGTDSTTAPRALATVTINVVPPVPRPIAVDDSYSTVQGKTLKVEAPGVIANDKKATPGSSLAALIGARPLHGVIEFHSGGNFTYTPAASFTGTDSFTYQVLMHIDFPGPLGDPNQYISDFATVTIDVRPLEPVAVNDFYITAENTPLGIGMPGVLANDYLKPAQLSPGTTNTATGSIRLPFTAVLVAGPANGSLSLNDDGSFKYEPKTDFVGIDTFTYQDKLITPTDNGSATDAAPILSNIATVSIRVVAAMARNDSYATDVNTVLEVKTPGVLANDSGGSQEHPLMSTVLVQPTHGTLKLAADGSFRYEPAPGYIGADMFTYRASDGTTTTDPATGTIAATAVSGDANRPVNAYDIGVVKIYVRPPAPTIQAHDDKYLTRENTALTIDSPGVLANDYGPVNVFVVAAVVDKPLHGTISLNEKGGFTYKPDADFIGEDKFTYSASVPAPAGSTASQIKSGLATVTIYVVAPDATPIVITGGDQKTTDESGPQKITDWAAVVAVDANGAPPAINVTTDKPELFSSPPKVDVAGQLVYTPKPNVSGTATISVNVANPNNSESGDTTTFTIHIDKPHEFTNTIKPCDVNDDRSIAADDAMTIINYINARGASQTTQAPTNLLKQLFYDVDKDGWIAAADVMAIINYINAHPGQSSPAAGEADIDVDLLTLVAQDAAEATTGKKKI